MSHVVRYLNGLRECGVGPSGQITKLTTLMDAMKMLISRVPDDGGDEKTKNMIVRSRVVETKLKGVCKSLRKENTMIRVQKRELFDTDSADRDRVLALLDDDRLFQLVSGYLAQEEMAESESLMTRRYLMCSLMYKNAQRQGTVVNLRLSEVSRAVGHPTKSGDRVHVYKVWQHKTCSQFGSANLVVPDKVHLLVLQYVEHHRPAPATGCEEFVFLTPQGRQIAHSACELKGLSKDFPTSLGVINVTSTQMRKLTSTYVAANGATDASIRTVATHMTHDPSTARKYYQHLEGVSKSVEAYDDITRKRSAPEEEVLSFQPKLKKRKLWLQEEEEALKASFDMTATPKIDDCVAFLQMNTDPELFKNRTPKELQDKCRTIIKKASK